MSHSKLVVILIAFAFLIALNLGVSAQSIQPRVFVLDAKVLLANKIKLADAKNSDANLRSALAKLERDAQKALKNEILTVTSKTALPPSGDKHDYMSQSPYFWKDPKSKDGMPYIRRDGEKNPEIKNFPDHDLLDDMMDSVESLSLAYYFTDNEEYAARASQILRTWFLYPKTLMNPNLNFAQAVPGQSLGRSFGIIETRGMYRVVDSIGLLSGSKSWKKVDQAGLETWFGKYLEWLTTSKNGIEESKAKNNHGTWYDVQAVAFALFVGKTEFARKTLESAKTVRIASHIEPDGSQPLELARTRSFGYSSMNLAGMIGLAGLGESIGVDIWNFQTSDGRSIRKAIDFLFPYATGEKKWTYPLIDDFLPERFFVPMRIASSKYSDSSFSKMRSAIPSLKSNDRAYLTSL